MLMDVNEFGEWISGGAGSVVYYRPEPSVVGRQLESLAAQCDNELHQSSRPHTFIRDMAWAAYQADKVGLVQRRVDGAIEYVAQKRLRAA